MRHLKTNKGFTRNNFYYTKENRNGLACRQAGFTLIELLISIAIIGILTAFGTFAFQNAFGKARDAQRRNDLKQLQTALQAYYNDYGKYPSTLPADALISGCIPYNGHTWCGESTGYGGKMNYIPTLAPKYIRRLPNDPRAGKDNTALNPTCTNTQTGYLYASDGTDYKLIAHCTEESPLDNPKDALYDPGRGGIAWAVFSDGASAW